MFSFSGLRLAQRGFSFVRSSRSGNLERERNERSQRTQDEERKGSSNVERKQNEKLNFACEKADGTKTKQSQRRKNELRLSKFVRKLARKRQNFLGFQHFLDRSQIKKL